MKHKKDKIIIVALSSLVLFSSSIALMLYLKNKETKLVAPAQTLKLFVASHSLKKGVQLQTQDIEIKSVEASQVNFPLLSKEEIVGKYLKVPIYTGEPLRQEKLTLEKESIEESEQVIKIETKANQYAQFDALSLPLNVFKNIDYTLQNGDYIDIASISNPDEKVLKTKYAALHVKILGFSKLGEKKSSYVSSKKVKEGVVQEFADTIVLDMPPRYIKNVLSLYYETQSLGGRRANNQKDDGHLWIVKTQEGISPALLAEKERFLVDTIIKAHTSSSVKTQKATISYEK